MNNHFELKVFRTIEDVCRAAANIFTDLLKGEGKNTFIVPGGTTPHMFYRCLAQQVCNWRDTTLVLSDERLVQENDPESNSGMIKRNLLDLIGRERSPKLVPVVKGFSPEQSSQILETLNSSARQLLPLKAAFLGIGTDGHTASLFHKLVVDNYNKEPFILVDRPEERFQRISVSSKILSKIPLLVFLVTGKEKKTVINKIVNIAIDNNSFPVQHVINKAMDKVMIICDRDAAPE